MDVLRFLIIGFALGGIYSLIGSSVVLVHRGSGVLNLSAAAIGTVGTFLSFKLHESQGWPLFLSVLAGLLLAATIGLAFHRLVMRRLAKAAVTTQVVATLALMTLMVGVGNLVFEPDGSAVSVQSLLPGADITAWNLNVGLDRLFIAGIAIAITIVLMFVQNRTSFGLATSAVAEDELLASTMGLSPALIAGVNWMISCVVSTIAVILIAPDKGLDVLSLSLLIVPGMAAALVGQFESFPLTLFGGLLIGIGESLTARYVSGSGWATSLPLLVIILVLIIQGSYTPGKGERADRMARPGTGRITPAAAAVFVLLAVLLAFLPFAWLNPFAISLVMALVVLSVVTVTGLTGQVSLAQLSLAGMGSLTTAIFAIKFGLPMAASILLGALATIPVGMVVALPAARARGSRLAIASLALATVINALILHNLTIAGWLVGPELPLLNVFGVPIDYLNNPRAFAFVSLTVLALAVVAVCNLRRGTAGRRMLATRANERAALSLGISVPGVKVFSFGLSAFLAGLAGGLLESMLTVADFTSAFPLLDSINMVLVGVIGGIGGTSGALVGGGMANGGGIPHAISFVVAPGNWVYVVSGLGAIAVVLQSGDGLIPLWVRQLRGLLGGTSFWRLITYSREPILDVAQPSEGPARARLTIEAVDVSVRFGGQLALDHVTLTVAPGEVVGVIGPNGAGKSTLIDVLSGFHRVYSGSVLANGKAIDSFGPSKRARSGVIRSFQNLELFEDMSIFDNIRIAEPCSPWRYGMDLFLPKQMPMSSMTVDVLREFGLDEDAEKLPSEVDYAKRRLVSIARAIGSGPGVLLLDEPAAGLDRTAREELATVIRWISERLKVGVLLIEHDVDLVFRLCDRVVALDSGRIIAQGSPAHVRADPSVVQAYLGATSVEGRVPANAFGQPDRPAESE